MGTLPTTMQPNGKRQHQKIEWLIYSLVKDMPSENIQYPSCNEDRTYACILIDGYHRTKYRCMDQGKHRLNTHTTVQSTMPSHVYHVELLSAKDFDICESRCQYMTRRPDDRRPSKIRKKFGKLFSTKTFDFSEAELI
jgi:hypothetical protein